jgi:hypothetical protein
VVEARSPRYTRAVVYECTVNISEELRKRKKRAMAAARSTTRARLIMRRILFFLVTPGLMLSISIIRCASMGPPQSIFFSQSTAIGEEFGYGNVMAL